jgi:phosphoglycerate dehydrogenase-like enzyme
MAAKINLLVNLPAGFYRAPALRPVFARLARMARVRKRSHDTADQIRPDLAWADAVLMWSWPALTDDLLDAAPRLRFAGQLDVSQAAARVALGRGLAVSTTRGAWSPAVAEMALALALATLRKVSDYHAAMRRGAEKWVRVFPTDIDPEERQLTGRPVGIIGFGAVGRRLAELLAPFACRPLRVYDPFVSADVAARYGARPGRLRDLVRGSDVVVLCAASNAGTRHLLARREIAALRRGAVLVNVARAALVDTAALVARLRRGDLYAAIDVFDAEPLPRGSPLRRLPNAYLTPHRAGGVMESVVRIVGWLADDLENHLARRPLRYPLTAAMLPALDR